MHDHVFINVKGVSVAVLGGVAGGPAGVWGRNSHPFAPVSTQCGARWGWGFRSNTTGKTHTIGLAQTWHQEVRSPWAKLLR